MPLNPNIIRIEKEKIIAILRLKDTSRIVEYVDRIVKGGITIIEVTLNSQNALDTIELLRIKFPKCLIGAGTVMGRKAAESAITAGAEFLVSPVNDGKMITVSREHNVVSMAGAFSPTEVWEAHTNGADFIKLFPLAGIGVGYLKALRGPFPDIRFIPTNGVTHDNMQDFFKAGATAIGLGSVLISDEDVTNERFDEVEKRAKEAVAGL